MDNILENKSRFTFGPFRLYPLIRLTDFGYDGNVYRQQEDRDPITDFTVTLSPSLDVNVLYRNWLILSLTESPEYIHYFKVSRERAWNNTLSTQVKMLMFQRIVIEGAYSNGKRRRRGTTEFDVRADEKSEELTARLFYETPRRSMLGLSYSVRKISWDDIDLLQESVSLSNQLNRTEQDAVFEFYYKLFSQTDLFVNFGFSRYLFSEAGADWRNSMAYEVNAGLRFPILGRMRGTLFLGYKELMPNQKDLSGFAGIVGGSTLDWRVGRFAFGLGYSRDSRFSYSQNNVFFITDHYQPGVSFYASRTFKLTYNFSYGINRYPEPEPIILNNGTVDLIKRRDVYLTHTVGFAVRVIGRTGIGMSLSWWQVDSNFYLRGARSQLFIGAYLTQDF
ncbi:MAG: outer membrane beta-barrel protein [Acidobacteria bacterium]|nr:outer membrane beta-barrel protein [Acidobacteriota bacterium]MCG2814833.1 outer membrane beta-barrel protein [Candidatus Aminicenantes bacterium]MBU1337729.1 outer membrane beta-barrel protein [Acidobacteriota bacterium]MBU1473704.1 outer membrane beta-barrel protein [Acidobacteriota bacterium]MBU4254226.1 outer membrane beta-barrel protein [Acidobacteriota bacterium]